MAGRACILERRLGLVLQMSASPATGAHIAGIVGVADGPKVDIGTRLIKPSQTSPFGVTRSACILCGVCRFLALSWPVVRNACWASVGRALHNRSVWGRSSYDQMRVAHVDDRRLTLFTANEKTFRSKLMSTGHRKLSAARDSRTGGVRPPGSPRQVQSDVIYHSLHGVGCLRVAKISLGGS